MTEIVLRWLPDATSQWLDAEGRIHRGLPTPSENLRLSVLVPGEDVLLLDVPRMARSSQQIEQAAAFAIEDQLAAPVELHHVAWGFAAPERLSIAVAARERMDAWLAPLHAAGLEAQRLCPDYLALPAECSALRDGERILLRSPDQRGLAMEASALAVLRPELSLPAASGELLPRLAAGIQQVGINLLQGVYAPRARSNQATKVWRYAAALAGVSVLLVLLIAVADQQKLAQKVADQEAQMAALYLRAVPNASDASNPALQLQSVLAAQGLGQGDAALDLLRRAAPAIAADARVSLDSLEYREGRLDVTLQAADVAGLDALRQRLNAAGVPAEITGSTPGTQGVQGRLRLGARP